MDWKFNESILDWFEEKESFDEPVKKRQKSETDVTKYIRLSTDSREEEENVEETRSSQLDNQIEQEEKKADNLVIKDLMGSIRPEPNKVIQSQILLFVHFGKFHV